MLAYFTGQKYDEFKKNGMEGPMFDLVDINHGQIMYFVKNPSTDFVEKFAKVSSIEIGMKYYRKQIMLTLRLGEMGYCDMVYAPQLSSMVSLEELRAIDEPEGGMSINILLINSVTGEVLDIQVLGTDLKFNKEFVKAMKDKLNTIYSKTEDQKQLKAIYSIYPTARKLAKDADVVFKIDKKGA